MRTSAIWLFGAEGKNMAIRVSAASTAAYVLAFWSGNFYARGIFGVTELAVVYYWWWFVVSRGMAEGFGRLDIPKLSVIFGLTTLAIGSTLGVIVQVILATGGTVPQSPDLVGAHASAQTGGYLVLVAAGFIEWQLTGGGKRTAAGLVQIALLFVSGLLLAFSLLLAAQLGPGLSQALPGIATPDLSDHARLGRDLVLNASVEAPRDAEIPIDAPVRGALNLLAESVPA